MIDRQPAVIVYYGDDCKWHIQWLHADGTSTTRTPALLNEETAVPITELLPTDIYMIRTDYKHRRRTRRFASLDKAIATAQKFIDNPGPTRRILIHNNSGEILFDQEVGN
jgi:hypothetical protein